MILYVMSALNRSRAEQALKARDAFLSNVSQELKDPLSRIVQLSDVKHLENSVNVKESMESMLDNLFSYSAMVQEEDAAREVHKKKRDIAKTILEVFANSLQINPDKPDNYEECVAWLQGLAAPHPEISACYIANPYKEHTVIMNTGWEPDPGWKVEERSWYKETVRNGDGISISSPYMDEQTGMYCITMATAFSGVRRSHYQSPQQGV